ncbi:MAG: hypothetical protein VX938_02320, partial [Myxococcota bacterium]|nr:hypothetical protein [Myxococcota bacterium]
MDGSCGGCLAGFGETGDGVCLPIPADPCSPDPCAPVHKTCLGGLCGACLPGFDLDVYGNCVAPSPCFPNPCEEPLRTYCTLGEGGVPVCLCSPGTHEGESGVCTYDPCDPNPCVEPFATCYFSGPLPECGCPEGSFAHGDTCADDPCDPNPCEGYAATTCELTEEGSHICQCDPGFIQDESGGCIEVAVVNGSGQQPAEGDVELDYSRQYLVDEYLIHSRTNTARRVHTAARPPGEGWVIEPELDQGVQQAAANGSLIHVGEEDRASLPDDHPLKPYPWRLYYQAYRPPPAGVLQPSWLCIAAAATPNGPWIKPVLVEEDPLSHCVLRQDGISRTTPAEVSLVQGQWSMSVTRSALGSVSQAGLYLYASDDGVDWWPSGEGPVLTISSTPESPAAYPRIGERSRLIWDADAERYVGFFSLPSQALGDARAVMTGSSDPAAGWSATPDPVSAPAILGPQLQEKAQGYVYGDMTAWREGNLWWGLVQKRQTVCPKVTFASLATSRDGRHWYLVQDEVSGTDTPVLAPHPAAGEPDSALTSFTGGAPADYEGYWHFFVGALSAPQFGSAADGCSPSAPEGGIGHLVIRSGGLAGIATEGASKGVIVSRPLRMKEGYTGSILE